MNILHKFDSSFCQNPYKTLLKWDFRPKIEVKSHRFYCKTNGKLGKMRKNDLKMHSFHCGARRIWPKQVRKGVQNGSNPYKTNGKPPNELSREYFCMDFFCCIYKNVLCASQVPRAGPRILTISFVCPTFFKVFAGVVQPYCDRSAFLLCRTRKSSRRKFSWKVFLKKIQKILQVRLSTEKFSGSASMPQWILCI